MRIFLVIIFLLAVLSTSCSRSGVPLQAGGELSVVERQNIVAVHPDFMDWEPEQSALWTRHGIVRHICLRDGGIGSLTEPYWVVVFDGDGRVVEANIIQAPNPGTAKTVSSVSPLQVAFEAEDGKTYVCGGEYSQATWQHDMQKEMDLDKKLREIIATWKRSGSINFAEVDRMIKSAITNSQK
jgi:hypothetical protein